ncbi:MAG: dimethylsulfonioproprionate lyase family protein [Pseudomonadota bacterium]
MAKPAPDRSLPFTIALGALIASLRERLRLARDLAPEVRARFDGALSMMAPLAPSIAPRRAAAGDQALPVLALWLPALAAAQVAAPDLAQPLASLGAALRWTQNPNYRRRPPAPDFLWRYAYAQFAGPPAAPTLVETDALAFGVLVLAPGTLYPAHSHPAEEIYLPLAPARWKRGTEGWRERPAGDLVHHPPHRLHATEAGRAPLLALYLWLGALGMPARIRAQP